MGGGPGQRHGPPGIVYRYLVKRFVPSVFEPGTRQSVADRTTNNEGGGEVREKSDNGNDDDALLSVSLTEDGPSLDAVVTPRASRDEAIS